MFHPTKLRTTSVFWGRGVSVATLGRVATTGAGAPDGVSAPAAAVVSAAVVGAGAEAVLPAAGTVTPPTGARRTERAGGQQPRREDDAGQLRGGTTHWCTAQDLPDAVDSAT